jgi:hypothetical protein
LNNSLVDAGTTGLLAPTVAARTLDVTATGAAGIDWANVENPTTAVDLSGTNIDVDQVVASVSGAVGSVTGAVGSVTGAVGSVTGNVGGNVVGDVQGNVDGSVASVSGNIGGLAAGAITDVENAVWDATLASHVAAGSTGEALSNASSAGDPWATALPGAYGAGTAGFILGTNLDALVSSRLAPTVAARTLDVSVAGNAGIDWANVENPTTALNLSGTNIDVDQVVASVSGAVGSVTGAVGSVTGNVGGNVTGSVGSIATGGITAASFAADAIDAAALAADAVAEIADGVWDEPIAGHLTAGSTGLALNSASSAGDPWATALPGAYGAGTAGSLLGRVPDVAAGAAGGLFIAGSNAATSIATALTANVIGNITGNLSGSVGSVTGAVGSVTGAVGSVTGNVGGNVVGTVASVVGNVGGNLVGDVQGNVDGSLGAMSAAALADFFTVDSGQTYGTAIAGSVVKEIADNSTVVGTPDVNVVQISGDAPAADALESILDGGGGTLTANVTGNLSGSVGSVTGAVGSVTGDLGGNVNGNVLGSVGSVTGAVGSVTGSVGGNVVGSVGSLAAQAKLDVNAEVVDVLSVDTFAEPTGVPPATTTLALKIGRLHQALRNGLTVTATDKTFTNDAGADLWKKPLSDDGTTYTEGEGVTP